VDTFTARLDAVIADASGPLTPDAREDILARIAALEQAVFGRGDSGNRPDSDPPARADITDSGSSAMVASADSAASRSAEPRAPRRSKERPELRVPEDVQQRIRELSASGMTRAAIAKKLGVSTGAVSKYKKPAAE
jgi:DNA-binding NarL/FixJ family response regulator